ncbi:MAG: DUF4199 domain-containing protein [Cytophagia bacterium]|nr:DUF4199 domain-containing protein [Cytophagia bacterium]
MKRLILRNGLGNTLTAVLVSGAVYFFSPVHPLGQFRLLLGVVTLFWLVLGIRDLKYKVQAGDLKVTHGLLFSAGSGLVAALSFGLVVWLLGTLSPEFWNDYLSDQMRNLGMASGLLETNYSSGTLSQLQDQIKNQTPASLAIRLTFFRWVWHLLAGGWVAVYFRTSH